MNATARSSFLGPLTGPAVFTVLYAGAATVYGLQRGNTEFLFYVGVLVVAGGLIALLHRRVGFTRGCLWALAVWGFSHMCGGLIDVGGQATVLYNVWLVGQGYGRGIKYDNLAHAYGFAVATWAAWECLRTTLADPTPRFGPLLAAVLVGQGLGAINEIIEFTATQIMPKTNVGDYVNNAWDLVFNLIGCVAAAGVIWWRGADGMKQSG